MMGVPEHLREEQLAVEAEIRAAFRGGKRHGGVSWSESREVDNYGSEDERAAARARDIEQRWEDLVDDPNWDHEVGVGGFNFLDAIGYAYYIAPAMIRCCREAEGERPCYALTMDADLKLELIRALDDRHKRAISRFLRFMIAVFRARDYPWDGWETAYESYWHEWDRGTPVE